MRKLQRAVDRISTAVSSVLLGVMMLVLVYNVFARFLGGGISWYMEFSQYANVWAVLAAGIGICACGQHLRISFIDDLLRGRWKIAGKVFTAALTVAFYLLFAYGTFLLATKAKQRISTMQTLRMAHVYWALPVCALLSAAAVALNAVVDVDDLLKGSAKG